MNAVLSSQGGRGLRALVSGLFLLVAQLVATAHGHSFATTFGVAQAADSATTSCSLCAFAAHSPVATQTSPSLEHAPDVGATVARPPRVTWCPPALSSPPGRGPPASV
jgi:hypothetical protein